VRRDENTIKHIDSAANDASCILSADLVNVLEPSPLHVTLNEYDTTAASSTVFKTSDDEVTLNFKVPMGQTSPGLSLSQSVSLLIVCLLSCLFVFLFG
jgi:hypothetical protein